MWMSLIGFVALLADTGAAHAQEDPYGGTTTTRQLPRTEVECELSATSGPAGVAVTATVRDMPPGSTVRLLFGGEEVGRGTVTGASTTVLIDFRVPAVNPGRYLVTAVGGDVTVACGTDTDGYFAVLAAQATRGDDRSLPRTGVYAALLVAAAAALFVVGRGVLEASRRRRRTLEQAMRAEAKHLASSAHRPG